MRFNGYAEESDRFEALNQAQDERRAEHEAEMKRGPVCSCGLTTGGRQFIDADGQEWTVSDISCPIHQITPMLPTREASPVDFHLRYNGGSKA